MQNSIGRHQKGRGMLAEIGGQWQAYTTSLHLLNWPTFPLNQNKFKQIIPYTCTIELVTISRTKTALMI